MGQLDDASMYFLATLPKEIYTIVTWIFSAYSIGELKGQSAKRGSLGKKLDLKGSNFKSLRGLETAVIQHLLTRVKSKEISISEMMKEAKKIKELKEVQKSFMESTGVSTWQEAQELYPTFTTAGALDEFVGCVATPR